jgi:hypothetical protein
MFIIYYLHSLYSRIFYSFMWISLRKINKFVYIIHFYAQFLKLWEI